MRRIRTVGALLVVACALCAAFASASYAGPNWKVNGKFLKAGEREAVLTEFEIEFPDENGDLILCIGTDEGWIEGKLDAVTAATIEKCFNLTKGIEVPVEWELIVPIKTRLVPGPDDMYNPFRIRRKSGSYAIEGSLEGQWNNSTATVEFPHTPLSGTALKASGGGTVVVSGHDKVNLAKGGSLEVGTIAGPERGTCKSKAKGKYKDSLCLEEGGTSKGHEFEWTPAKTAAYTATTGAATLKSFDAEGALPAVECKSSKSKGKAGATESTSIVTFSECTSAGEKCTGSGTKTKPKAGQIITYELDGTLGTISAAGKSVGEDLVGTGPGGISSKFACGTNTIETRGSVIGVVAPTDVKASTTHTLTFSASGASQIPEEFEGEPKDTLETELDGLGSGTFPFPSVEETTATTKGASVELRT